MLVGGQPESQLPQLQAGLFFKAKRFKGKPRKSGLPLELCLNRI